MEKSRMLQTTSIIMTVGAGLLGAAATFCGNKEKEERDNAFERARYQTLEEFRREGRTAIDDFRLEGQKAIGEFRDELGRMQAIRPGNSGYIGLSK